MSEALMTIGEFAEMLGPDTQIKGAPGIKFSSVSFDSRSVRPNGLFFAIEGERDGHEFVQAASDAGAAAAVVTHFVPVSLPQVLCQEMALEVRPACDRGCRLQRQDDHDADGFVHHQRTLSGRCLGRNRRQLKQ